MRLFSIVSVLFFLCPAIVLSDCPGNRLAVQAKPCVDYSGLSADIAALNEQVALVLQKLNAKPDATCVVAKTPVVKNLPAENKPLAAPDQKVVDKAKVEAVAQNLNVNTENMLVSEVRTPLNYPLQMPIAWYRKDCSANPLNRLACSSITRSLEIKDVEALREAKRLGITINIPKESKHKKGDYEVTIEDPNLVSPIVLQLTNAKKKLEAQQEEEAAKKAKDEAAKKAAEAGAAAAKAADDAAKAAAQLEELKRQQAAAQDAQAKAALEAQIAAQQKAAADAEAARQRAAAEAAAAEQARQQQAAAAAATPKLTCEGGKLVAPDGRTLYINSAAPRDPTACDFPSGCGPNWPIGQGAIAAGTGVSCAVGSVARPDVGADQWTCGGRLLYKFKQDSARGDTKGHNQFGFVTAPCA